MRIFNEMVFNGYVTGGTDVFSEDKYQELLGFADQLSIGAYTAQVTGTTPTLTVQVQQSFDKFRWQARNSTSTPEISAATLSGGTTETILHGYDGNKQGPPPNDRPVLPFVRLRISLGGTNPTAQVRVWATGRDCSQE